MSDNSVPLGQQIRRLREKHGWTLAQLARHAGTSGPTLHRYENGWDRFELGTLRRISSALGARLEIRLVPAALHAAKRRGVDARTRRYWRLTLAGGERAPDGHQR